MELDIMLRNYRCFSDARPATIELRKGLTAFVGPNNSGKSALLRFFYEFRPFFEAATAQWQTLINGNRAGANMRPEVLDYEELFSFTNRRDIMVELVPVDHLLAGAPTTITALRGGTAEMRLQIRDTAGRNVSTYQIGNRRGIRIGQQEVDFLEFQAIFECLAKAVYIGAFRNALNRGGSAQSYFDIPVGQGFISEWAFWQAGNVKQLNNAAARVVEHIREIFGFGSLAITAGPENQNLNFVTNGRPLKDHEVGSGLTQVLMVLATVAMKEPTYILIDEPELNLHPSLQVKFLMALASYARYGVLFGTHSVGLARTVADRIFSVQQANEGQSEIKKFEDTRNLAELLGEMSFSAYREMGFEKILLVEGRTEVKAVQQFLRLLKKDQKIVPVPLGGSGMICADAEHELFELRRLCDHVYALIDSERKDKGEEVDQNRRGFVGACEKAGIACKVLHRRATENYFPGSAIARAFPEHPYEELGPYEKLSDRQPSWAKADNWRIAAEMTRDQLLETDLGKFLDSI